MIKISEMRVIISRLLYVIRMRNFVLISNFYYLEKTLSAKRVQIDLITVLDDILMGRSTLTRRKPSRSKDKIQQQTQPAYDAKSGNGTRATGITVIYIPVIVVYCKISHVLQVAAPTVRC